MGTRASLNFVKNPGAHLGKHPLPMRPQRMRRLLNHLKQKRLSIHDEKLHRSNENAPPPNPSAARAFTRDSPPGKLGAILRLNSHVLVVALRRALPQYR